MNDEFNDMQVYTGEESPVAQAEGAQAPVQIGGGALSSEQARVVAEVQVAMTIAQARPRREAEVWARMNRACSRPAFATQAMFAFRRGGTMVTGPSIRLAEELARCFGNLDYGFRELERDGGGSRVLAYAWDQEANVRVQREFHVAHIRDTRAGGKALTAERDKYEAVASQAQRRVRACLLEIIPGDLVERAVEVCAKTIRDGDGRPLADRVRDAVVAFAEYGVTEEQVEAYLQHPIRATVPEELPRLAQVFRGLRDGMLDVREVFPIGAPRKGQPAGESQAKRQAAQDGQDSPKEDNPAREPAPEAKAAHAPHSDAQDEPQDMPTPPPDDADEEPPPDVDLPGPDLPPRGGHEGAQRPPSADQGQRASGGARHPSEDDDKPRGRRGSQQETNPNQQPLIPDDDEDPFKM